MLSSIPKWFSTEVYFSVKIEEYVNSRDVCIIVLKIEFHKNFLLNFAEIRPTHWTLRENGSIRKIKKMLQVAMMTQMNIDPMFRDT